MVGAMAVLLLLKHWHCSGNYVDLYPGNSVAAGNDEM